MPPNSVGASPQSLLQQVNLMLLGQYKIIWICFSMRIRFVFSNGLAFRYLLNDSFVAKTWLGMMKNVNPADMSRISENHRHGFASPDEIDANIIKLTQACALFDMPKVDLAANNWQGWQQNLNAIHVMFPEVVMSGINTQAAHTVNLLIHWLEYELYNRFEQAGQYLFNLDFNHQPHIYRKSQIIPADEMGNFTTDIKFGSLNLHYIYIGRHFLEMVNAFDLICLKDHFRPQWHFNPTCAINFSEPSPQSALDAKMLAFYQARGGHDFFGMDYSDPRMAKGFFNLGQMENLEQFSFDDREQIRDALKTAHVVHWDFD